MSVWINSRTRKHPKWCHCENAATLHFRLRQGSAGQARQAPQSAVGNRSGFTFIEVLVAMLIFVMAALAAVTIADGAVRATRDSKELSTATLLLQGVITELEMKVELRGFDPGCQKKEEGRFEAPHEKYSWSTSCYEVDFRLSQAVTNAEGKQESKENMIQKTILSTANEYFKKAIRELHAEVYWMQGKNKRTVEATTHFAKYDLPLALPQVTP